MRPKEREEYIQKHQIDCAWPRKLNDNLQESSISSDINITSINAAYHGARLENVLPILEEHLKARKCYKNNTNDNNTNNNDSLDKNDYPDIIILDFEVNDLSFVDQVSNFNILFLLLFDTKFFF